METKNNIPEIEIDKKGKFKYIQIKITNKENKQDQRIIIKGTSRCKFHNDIFKEFMEKLNVTPNDKFIYEPIGGGKIEFNGNKIYINGESSVYGPCDHQLTSEKLEKFFGKGKYDIIYEK